MKKTPERDAADTDRRAFLETAAGVVVPPAMIMLLSTSMASPAIAASGGSTGGGGPGFLPVLLGAPALAAGGATAAAELPAVVGGAEVVTAPSPEAVERVAPSPPDGPFGPAISPPPQGNPIARAGERG